MTRRTAALTQNELTGYAAAMQAAGVAVWAIDVEKPDGTRIRICAGNIQATAGQSFIDKRLGITNG